MGDDNRVLQQPQPIVDIVESNNPVAAASI